jgi:branched-chain amino acid transport system permease protein
MTAFRIGLIVVVVVVLAVLPLFGSDVLIQFGINALLLAVLAQGWSIIGGYTGYPSFGNSVFYGLGSYGVAIAMVQWNLPFALGMIFGVVFAVGFAFLLGIPVLRLKGHYFAIATLGVGIAVRELVNNLDCVGLPGGGTPFFCLGGASGIILPPVRRSEVQASNLSFYIGALALLALGTGALWLLGRSKFGYGLRAIRENEEAASVMGVNTTRFKVAAFTLAAVWTGLAGATQGLVNGSVLPDQTSIFDPYRSLEVIIICLIGGVGTTWGPAIGAFTLYAVQEALNGIFGAGDWRPIFFGAIVILLILFLPRGVVQFVGGRTPVGWRALWRNLVANRV